MRANGWLWLLVLAGLFARLAWGFVAPADEANLARLPDQREYLELGRNLIRGEGLHFTDLRFNDVAYAYRTPGYPLLVALCGGNVRAIRIVQALIDASTILAVYVLARRWLPVNKSLLAAGIVAANPYLIYFSALVLSETLFTAMLVWGMALIVRAGPATLWWGGAVLLALSVLVRPSAVVLPVALAICAAVVNRGQGGPYQWRWSPPVGATMLLLVTLFLLPWGYRNSRVLKQWIWTTTNTGITLYDGFNPDARGGSDQRFVRTMPQLRTMTEVERSDYLRELAIQYIRAHPAQAAILAAAKVIRTWSPVPLSDEYGGNRAYVAAALVYMIPFMLMILYGLWFGSPSTSAKVYLLVPAIYFTLAHAVSVGSLRYRIPADVPMAVIAASMQMHRVRAPRVPLPLREGLGEG